MDTAALAGRLEAIEGRLVGTDAERRAALLCAEVLRSAGRRPRLRTVWVRPRPRLALALLALIGVAGSVTAVSAPAVGLGLAAGAALATLAELAGVPVASLLQTRRATQNVVAAARGDRPVRLVLAASVAAPRDGLLERTRRVPRPAHLLLAGLAGIAACAGARLAGAEGAAIGAVQLVPSVLLIALLGALLDAELAGPARPASAAGPAAALALAAALDAQPPRNLAVEVLLTGGEPGLRAYVAEQRRLLAPEDVVVVLLEPGSGPIGHATRHRRLRELAAALPGAVPARQPGPRLRRWPAIALHGEPRSLAAAALWLVAAIDREVAQARSADRR